MAKAKVSLSLAQARKLALESQGLLGPAPFGRGKAGVQRALEHLGYVQIDTISVVERAHHHVLWSRVPDYSPGLLHGLMTEDRTVFEYWSHAASFLPMRDYRFSLPRKRQFAEGRRHWFRRNRKTMAYVLDRIRSEGPLQARDFETKRKAGNWFDWKPTKIALEQLFQEGSLMIRERKGFQKVYDLPERVLPPGVDQSFPDAKELARHLVEAGLRAHGIGTARQLGYMRKGMTKAVASALREGLEAGRIESVRIEGLEDEVYYCDAENLRRLSTGTAGDSGARARILSPFDSFIIQRKRVERLFDYDYQIECYLPEPKRRFGYFCLPILWSGRPVARLDAKADRQRSVLEVKSLHLEEKGLKKGGFMEPFREALDEFARFNGCENVAYR
jgi:uncharacterized protein YcaQ